MAEGIEGPLIVKSGFESEFKPLIEKEKQRAREQWGQDPCGAEYVREHEFGSREFFEGVERNRYTEYAPWMRRVMEFESFSGARLLEVGCGMGSDLLQFARGGALCVGLDLTPRSVEISRHCFALNSMPGQFLVSDGERLPFAAETFDVVYSNGVLHHTPDTAAAIKEIHRVLRNGGITKVMLYHRNSLNYWFEIILRRGLLKGQFFRGQSAEEIMSQCVEHSEHDARPLVQVYSRTEARRLFKNFREIKIEVEQLIRAELRMFAPIVPESLFRCLQHAIGWNVIVTAKK